MVDCMRLLVEQGATRGALKAVRSSFTFLETVAIVPLGQRFSAQVVFADFYDDLRNTLRPRVAPTKAPRLALALLLTLKALVLGETAPPFHRDPRKRVGQQSF